MGESALIPGIFIGLALAVCLGLPIAWVIASRRLRRTRAAERRALAAERLAEIGAMTGGLAHEIRNPLSTVGMNAQLLAEGIEDLEGVDTDEQARLIRRIGTLRREVDRLGDILGDFLRFAGEVRLSTERADLNVVVEELTDFFTPQAEHEHVRMRTDLAPGPLWVRVDASQFKQALLNLVLNATQAMAGSSPDGGAAKELILRTERGEEEGGPVCRLHVIDTGPGIEQGVLGNIFTPYFSTKAGGTGLGLPTTKRLIEAHGGTIEALSEPGRGTDFVITLSAED
ncbi:two-component sensor histidine kinase [Planctomycetaceae bacterium AH-315-I19]|nr:two-component sensor histidine kinase [Planctomycetaceae bacterium AH-315-I19]